MAPIWSRPMARLALAAAAIALAALGAVRNRIDPELAALLPERGAAARAMARYAALFGRRDLLVVLVEGGDPAAVAAASDALAERLRAVPGLAAVRHRTGPEALTYLRAHRWVLVDDRAWLELERRAADPRTGRRLRALLNSPAGGVALAGLAEDPLGVAEVVGRPLARHAGIDARTGLFASPDGRAALLVCEPAVPTADPLRTGPLLRGVRAALAPAPPGVRVGLTGGPVYRQAYAQAIRRDLLLSSLASAGAILLLFGLFFRSLRILPLVGLSLGAAYLLTLGIWGALVGRIGAVSLAFGGILLGIGVDVPIQLWSRIREERAAAPDAPPTDAIDRTLRALGGPAVVATLAPAAVFAACALSRFRALAELGALAALGLCANLGVMLLVFPALLRVSVRLWSGAPPAARGERWLERLGRACARRHRLVLGLAGLVVAVAGWLGHLRLAPRPLAFESTLEPSRVEDRLEAAFGPRRGRTIAFAEAATPGEALAADDRMTAALRVATSGPVESLADLLPSDLIQNLRLERVAARRGELEKRLRRTLAAAGLRADAFAPFFASLRQPERATLPALERAGLGFLAQAHLVRGPEGGLAVAVYAGAREAELDAAVAGVDRAGGRATGLPLVEREMARALPGDLARVTALSIALVALLLAVYYRRGWPVLLCLGPLGAAWVVFAALMPPVSVWNILALPLVVGYGIDDHVFVVARTLEGESAGRALRLAGRAVVLTSLATLAGFGSLLLVSFAGIRSLGAAGVLAVALCLAAAMLLLPALVGGVSARTRNADHSLES